MELLVKGNHLSFVMFRKISLVLGRKINWTFNTMREQGVFGVEYLCRGQGGTERTQDGETGSNPAPPVAAGISRKAQQEPSTPLLSYLSQTAGQHKGA